MKRNIILIFAIFLAPGLLSAASIFSAGSIGVMEEYPGGRAQGMGILGLALEDTMSVGFMNPALWSGINLTCYSVGVGVSRYYGRDKDNDDLADDFTLQSIALGIPMGKGLILGFHLTPISRMYYRWLEEGSVSSVSFTEISRGEGGLSSGSMILSMRLSQNVKLGFSYGLLWGTFADTVRVDFKSTGYNDSEFILSREAWGSRLSAGLQVVSNKGGRAGLFISAPVKIDIEQELNVHADSTATEDLEMTYPLTLGAGLGYPLSAKVYGSVDYLWQMWESSKQDIGSSTLYRESHHAGAGIEIAPVREALAPFLQRVTYRMGMNYAAMYYKSLNGNTVSQWTISFGMGIPVKEEKARLDAVLSYTRRGDLDYNQAEEDIFRLSLFFNFGQRWFERKKWR